MEIGAEGQAAHEDDQQNYRAFHAESQKRRATRNHTGSAEQSLQRGPSLHQPQDEQGQAPSRESRSEEIQRLIKVNWRQDRQSVPHEPSGQPETYSRCRDEDYHIAEGWPPLE